MTKKQVDWAKIREKERVNRRNRIAKLTIDQRVSVIKLHKLLNDFLPVAMYPDMGGIECVSAYDLQQLYYATQTLEMQFNLGDD